MTCLHARPLRAFAPSLTCCLLTLTLWLQTAPPARAQTPASAPTGHLTETKAPAQPSDLVALTSDATITREIKGGETHSYRVALKPGEFLRATVEQGIDVAVTLYGPAGGKLLTVDLLKSAGTEPVSFVAKDAGAY